MHPNPLFRTADREANLAFVRGRGFGVLTVSGPGGPLASHVPFVVGDDGTTVELHLSRKGELARQLTEPTPALLIVSGPDAYVSPDWYGLDEQVPTWNYVAVHLRGRLVTLADDALPPHLDRLAAVHEAVLAPKPPWTSARVSEARLSAMRAAIVACRLDVEAIDGTQKLGQNKPETARKAAALAVEQAGYGSEAAALAAAMRET